MPANAANIQAPFSRSMPFSAAEAPELAEVVADWATPVPVPDTTEVPVALAKSALFLYTVKVL